MMEYTGYFFTTLGALFIFLAALSVVRFAEFYSRLNGFIKFSVFGVICMALGVMAFSGFSPVSVKATLCCLIIIVTLPAEAQLLIDLARKTGIEIPVEPGAQKGTK